MFICEIKKEENLWLFKQHKAFYSGALLFMIWAVRGTLEEEEGELREAAPTLATDMLACLFLLPCLT